MEFSGPISRGGVVDEVREFEIRGGGVVDEVREFEGGVVGPSFPARFIGFPARFYSFPARFIIFKIDVKIREICICCRETVRRHSNP